MMTDGAFSVCNQKSVETQKKIRVFVENPICEQKQNAKVYQKSAPYPSPELGNGVDQKSSHF